MPVRYLYAETRWGTVQHFVWTDERGNPEPLTACGRRWASLSAERSARPLCDDCERGRRVSPA